MNNVIEINQSVIPAPEPGIACGSADRGGYTVQPAAAGPDSTKSEVTITTELAKKNQYDNAFMKPEAISRAPICNGIRRFEKVPDRPAVNTKNTIMVP